MDEILRIGLVPAPDESLMSGEVQFALESIDEALEGDDGLSGRIYARSGLATSLGHLGDYAVPLAQVLAPTFAAIVVSWLKGRAGRKVKVRTADTVIEAQTAEEVAFLIDRVAELHAKIPPRRTRAKKP